MTADRATALRWSACFGLALCFHVAGAAALLARWNEGSDLVANAPVITIDLAPIVAAPVSTPNELAPGPLQMQAEQVPQPEKQIDKIEVPVAPQAELEMTLPTKPIDKPKDKKPKQKHASLASAPSPAEQISERAAAPVPGASSRDPNVVPNWKSQLVAQIERHKRYPEEAHGERGVAQVAFGVDRSGGVHHARVVASSGSNVLDRDAIAWLERSQPLPPPPPEMGGAMISITVPLRYNYR
jgi:protein TonB